MSAIVRPWPRRSLTLEERQNALKARLRAIRHRSPQFYPARYRKGPGWVYVISMALGPVKIGITCADNPFDRIAAIERDLPFPVEIHGLLHVDEPSHMEAKLHTEYAHARIKGEWFGLTAAEVVSLLNDTGFLSADEVREMRRATA